MKSINLGYGALGGGDDIDCSLLMEGDIIWMNWFLDLPNLTSLTSTGYSLGAPRSVTLTSNILNDWMINRYSESTNS